MKTVLKHLREAPVWYILWIIFFITLAIRLYSLASLPKTFQEDEILSGYVGRYILENGKDIYGNTWPLLYFNKFGDYYIILPMYLNGISTYLFGINEFAVRLPAALIGSFVIFPVYWLAAKTFQNRYVGYIAAFLIAVTPWHFVLSRAMVEGITGTTVFLSAFVLLLKSIEKERIKVLFLAALLFLVTYFIYHPFRLYVPAIFFPAYLLFNLQRKKAFIAKYIGIHLFFILLTMYISSTPWGSGRLMQTSIFSEISGVQIETQQQIYNLGEGRVLEAKIFHNKLIGFGREFIGQYLTYFSPLFLFIEGGAESRYDVPNHGLYYLTFLICLIALTVPIAQKFVNSDKRLLSYIILLILLAPIPAAVTYVGAPNIHRASLLGVILIIPVAVGFYKIIISRYRFLIPLVAIIFAGEIIYFGHQYSTQADIYTSMRRNDGFKELVQYVNNNQDQYDEVWLPAEGNTALYYLFFTNDFSHEYSKRFTSDAHIDRIGTLRFIKAACPTEHVLPQDRGKNILIVNRHQCPDNTDFNQITTIRGVNILLGFKVLVPR